MGRIQGTGAVIAPNPNLVTKIVIAKLSLIANFGDQL